MWKAYKSYWKKTFRYRDRATRSEFWWPALVNIILTVVAVALLVTFLIYAIGVVFAGNVSSNMKTSAIVCLLVALPVCLFLAVSVLPTIAVTVRRLRDVGLSGWTYLVYLIANAILPSCGKVGVLLSCLLEIAMVVLYCLPADTIKHGWWSPDFRSENVNDKVIMDSRVVAVKTPDKQDK